MSDERRLGRYVLDRKIATGGMAEIWLAHQAGPAGFAKEIVIKRILPHLADDTKFVEMFLDEARLAAALQHPNIAQIYDLGELDGSYFIAMEYVDGCDLEAVIQRSTDIGRFVPPPIAARLIADACAGLDYAHTFRDRGGREVGLVHRDISPQNLLLSQGGIVKIVDFGVAKATTSSHKTQTGAVKGKLSYMSPEQISAQPLDGRSDVFSLGIVLYELVTNQRPFGHESELMAVTAILNEEPPPPRTLTAAVPEELEHVIYRALAKDRDERFASASEMQLALEQYLQHQGTLLTNRDVAGYLADLFSENPSGTIPALERQAGAQLGVGGTVAGVISSATRPHASASTQTMVHEGQDDDVIPPRRGRGALIAVVLLVVAVLIGAGFGIMHVIAPAEGSGDSSTTASTTPDVATDGTPAALDDVDAAAPPAQIDTRTVANETVPPTAGDTNVATAALDAAAEPTNDAAVESDVSVGETDADELIAEIDAGTPEPDAADPMLDGDTMVAAVEPADTALVEPDAVEVAAADTAVVEQPDRPEETVEPVERPVERATTGTIRVLVTSGGRQTVYVDGRQVGTLPGRSSFTVDAGRRSVRVVGANGEEFTDTVTVTGGETSMVRVRF